MSQFYKETDRIYRLRVPFDTVYTSVFLIDVPHGAILVDCATTDADVDECIVPALQEMGLALSDVRAIVLTHSHDDHAGGHQRILSLSPQIETVTDVRRLWDGIETYPMAGHTADSIGVLDTHAHTLLSGDGLQGAGVDKYRCYTKEPMAYLETVERIQNDKQIENILFSHAYEPWNCDRAIGRETVDACLAACIEYFKEKRKNEGNFGKRR